MSEKRGSSPGYGYGWMRGYWMFRPTPTPKGGLPMKYAVFAFIGLTALLVTLGGTGALRVIVGWFAPS